MIQTPNPQVGQAGARRPFLAVAFAALVSVVLVAILTPPGELHLGREVFIQVAALGITFAVYKLGPR